MVSKSVSLQLRAPGVTRLIFNGIAPPRWFQRQCRAVFSFRLDGRQFSLTQRGLQRRVAKAYGSDDPLIQNDSQVYARAMMEFVVNKPTATALDPVYAHEYLAPELDPQDFEGGQVWLSDHGGWIWEPAP